jgi:hypothetical protein
LGLEVFRNGSLVYRNTPPAMRTNDGIHLVRHRTRSPSTRLLIEEITTVAADLARSGTD